MLRVIFMGTPDFAVPALTEIVGSGFEVVAAYTQPPRRAGRGMAERKSPVAEVAEGFAIPVFTPVNFKEASIRDAFTAHRADVAVVAAYGLILPQEVLDAPAHGCLNLHASLLPRWRGAAPIQRAIMAGDRDTGIGVMRMEAGLDTGPVCLEERLAISDDMTAGMLHDALARLGGPLIVRALHALSRGSLDCRPQAADGIEYAAKVDKAETRIDWSRPADEVHDHIRGLSPFPGAWFEVERGGKRERVKGLRSVQVEGSGAAGTVLDDALSIACGDGAVRLLEVQRAGKGPVAADAFLRGIDLAAGTVLD